MAGPVTPLTCISWSEFEIQPDLLYGLVTLCRDGSLQYDPSRINVMATEPTDDKTKHNRILYAETIEELEEAKRDLKSRPFLMVVETRFSHQEHYAVVRVTTHHRGKFALLVNPAHSMISNVIDAKVEQAKECLLRGEKYCIELNFNPAVAMWYKEMVDPRNFMRISETAVCKYGRVYITNHAPYQHCFDCNKVWCCLCGPCWLLSAPCYMIHRSRSCNDFRYKFEAVPVSLCTALATGQAANIIGNPNRADTIIVQQGVPIAQPGVQMAQPAVHMAQPGVHMAQPGVPMAQPGVPLVQPGVPVVQHQPAGYGLPPPNQASAPAPPPYTSTPLQQMPPETAYQDQAPPQYKE